MTGRIEKTVFISYRRTNKYIALAIYQNLITHQYKVFIDYENIKSGDFEQSIIENIKAHVHFIVVLTPSALDRCNEPNDWLRREIETAMEYKRNIVPIMMEGFSFGDPSIDKYLTGRLASLKKYQGLEVPMNLTYFKYAMRDLRERYLAIELDAVTHPSSPTAQKLLNEQQTAANKLVLIEQKVLSAQEWFERGYVLQQNKNLEEAISCYKEAIELQPDAPGPYNNLGNSLDELKQYEEAEKVLRKAIELAPALPEVYSNLGNVLKNLKRYGEAEVAYHKAIELDASFANAYNNLGSLLDDLERHTEAEAAFHKAIKLKPTFPEAFSNVGNTLFALKRIDEAEKAHRYAISLNPNYDDAYYNLGTALKETGRYDEAEVALRKAIELNPKNMAAYNNLGGILKDLKRYSEAEFVFRKLINLDPANDGAYYNLGLLLRDLKRFREAETIFREAIKINPSDAKLQWNLGVVLYDLKRYTEAETFYRQAIGLDSLCTEAYNNFGTLLSILQRVDEAETAYRKAIELSETSTTVNNSLYALIHHNLGLLLQSMKRYDEAEASYWKAINLDTIGNSYNSLCTLLRQQGRNEEALLLLERQFELQPNDFNPYLAVASMNKQMGKDVPISYTEKARKFIPEYDWYNRACLESVCDNFDLAFEYLEKAAQIERFNPAWAWADPDLQWIRDDPRFAKIVGTKPE